MYQFIIVCQGAMHSGFFYCPSEPHVEAYDWFLAFIGTCFPGAKVIKFTDVGSSRFCLIDNQKIDL